MTDALLCSCPTTGNRGTTSQDAGLSPTKGRPLFAVCLYASGHGPLTRSLDTPHSCLLCPSLPHPGSGPIETTASPSQASFLPARGREILGLVGANKREKSQGSLSPVTPPPQLASKWRQKPRRALTLQIVSQSGVTDGQVLGPHPARFQASAASLRLRPRPRYQPIPP